MPEFLSVNTVFFTVAGYPMSYIEFFGTLLNLLCVWLVAKNKIWNWPIGIVAVCLFFLLFYEIRLYSDMLEQAYFFVTGFWGWYVWSKRKPRHQDTDETGELQVTAGRVTELVLVGLTVLIGTVVVGRLMSQIHLMLPAYFVEPADFPYLDALTTIMSFTATVLMVRRKVDCWYLWIAVDFIGIWLYWVKGVKFIAVEYGIFLVLASYGLYKWHKILKTRQAYEALQQRAGGREILPAAPRA